MLSNYNSSIILLSLLIMILLKFIFTRKTINLIPLIASFSLISCLVYLDMSAPDVALTEAAIGVSLGSILTIISLINNDTEQQQNSYAKIIIILPFIITAIFISIKIAGFFPNFGEVSNFVPYQVADYYTLNTKAQIGINSITTAILADYRAFDTFLETLVMLIVLVGSIKLVPQLKISKFTTDFFQQKILQISLPITLILSFYILLNGKLTPGGGFQFGAMIASILVIFFLVKKKEITRINSSIFLYLSVLGVMMYLATGIYSIILGDNLFTYNNFATNQHKAHQIAIFIIEIGIGITIAAVCCLLVIIIFSNLKKMKRNII